VLRFSFVFCLSMFVVVMVAGLLIWNAAARLGVFGDITKFMKSIGFDHFTFRSGVVLRASALGGLVLVIVGTAGSVVAAVLYNLISDIVGGVEVVFLEEEIVTKPASLTAFPTSEPATVAPGPLPIAVTEGNGAVAASRVTSIRSGL